MPLRGYPSNLTPYFRAGPLRGQGLWRVADPIRPGRESEWKAAAGAHGADGLRDYAVGEEYNSASAGRSGKRRLVDHWAARCSKRCGL